MSNRLYNQFAYSPERQPIHLMGKFTQSVSNVQATLVNQGVTYTAIPRGVAGNAISVRLIVPAGDGPLAIVVTGSAIVVTLEKATGSVVTTATALVAALAVDPFASVLMTPTGSGASPLTTLAATNLSGGIDAVMTDTAMRMSMTQPSRGTYILQLEDEFPALLAMNMSLQAASAADIMLQVAGAAVAFGTAKQITIRSIKASDRSLVSLTAGDSMYIHLILRNSNP